MIDFAQRFDSLTFAQQRAFVPALEIFAEFAKAYAGQTGSVVLPKSETRRRLTKDAAARFRAMLVADMWEPDLRAELVDRIVAAFEAGYFDAATLKAVLKRAADRKRDYETSGGLRGKSTLWASLATWLKGVYKARNVEWTPCSSAVEPAPTRTRRLQPVELAIASLGDDDEEE